MGIKNINQNLKEIEQKVYHCLESASKYSYDQSIDETDYSKEFLYFELFYALGNYERAIKTLEIKSNIKERYESVYQLALETLKLEENTYFDRLDVFGKEYFSDKRYDDQINKFKQSMNFSSLEDISVMSPSSHGISGRFFLMVLQANLVISFAYTVWNFAFSNPKSIPIPQVKSEITVGFDKF